MNAYGNLMGKVFGKTRRYEDNITVNLREKVVRCMGVDHV
jgi:hypothetical protein